MTASAQLLKAQTANIIAGALIFDFSDMGLSTFYPGGNAQDLYFLLDGTLGSTPSIAITFGHKKATGTNSTGNPKVYSGFYAPAAGAVTLAALGWSAKVPMKFTAMQVVITGIVSGSSLDLFVFN